MKKNIFIPLILIFTLVSVVLLSNSIYSGPTKLNQIKTIKKCSSLSYEESKSIHPKNFKSINLEIKFDKIRDWRKENILALAKAEQNKKDSGYFRKFFSDRKRVDATIIFKINDEISCLINAKIRSHGDLEDHQNTFLPSLNVNLIGGHIYGITKFKLLIPETRRFDNELFAANLFKEIGILSPRTSKAKVEFFGKKKIFIFQESIEKEFIENNNKREFPLYTGDERFYFFDSGAIRGGGRFGNYKLINGNFARGDNSKKTISEYGLSLLNKLDFLNDSEFYPDSIDLSTLSREIYDENLFVDFGIFSSLMFAMNSHHNLSKGNLRLYFDKEGNVFNTIYYDGDVELGKKNVYLPPKCAYSKKNINCHLLQSAIFDSKNSIRLIDSVDLQKFKNKLLIYNLGSDELNLNGKKIKINSIDKVFEIIKKNLRNMSLQEMDKRVVISKVFKDPAFVHLNNNKRIINPENRRLIFNNEKFDSLVSCNIFYKECIDFDPGQKKINKLLSQNLKIKKDEIDIDLNYTSRTNNKNKSIWIHEFYHQKFLKKKKIQISDDFFFSLIGEVDFQIDETKKKIIFLKKNQNSKIIFEKLKLKNWEIIFNDVSSISLNTLPRMDIHGYTGCLNFFDTILRNVKIKFSGSKCEDAVNFVRSEGNIEKIEVINSAFDGVDADFSKIKFDNIIIKKSGNDCLDFSYGNYLLKNSNIFSCGDKGISVGESSYLEIKRSIIENSETGIASKDFSEVEILNIEILNTKYCFQAYNKKQEFSGGLIKIENSKCGKTNQFVLNKDKNSEIIYKK